MVAAKLVVKGIWPRITRLAKKSSTAQVAVAYLGKGAADRLPLPSGALLVTDFSLSAIRSGQTDPKEVGKLLASGVRVHSVANLHAKVFVLGDSLVLGSANASNSSANNLVEAVIETSASELVADARRFVKGLAGDEIGQEYAKRMEAEFRPPKFGPGGAGPHKTKRRANSKRAPRPLQSPLWLAPLVEREWSAVKERAADLGRPAAKKKVNTRTTVLDEFAWDDLGDRFFREVAPGHQIVQIVAGDDGQKSVSPPGRIVHLRRYRQGKKAGFIAFLETPKRARGRSWAEFLKSLGSTKDLLPKLSRRTRLVAADDLASAIRRVWQRK